MLMLVDAMTVQSKVDGAIRRQGGHPYIRFDTSDFDGNGIGPSSSSATSDHTCASLTSNFSQVTFIGSEILRSKEP